MSLNPRRVWQDSSDLVKINTSTVPTTSTYTNLAEELHHIAALGSLRVVCCVPCCTPAGLRTAHPFKTATSLLNWQKTLRSWSSLMTTMKQPSGRRSWTSPLGALSIICQSTPWEQRSWCWIKEEEGEPRPSFLSVGRVSGSRLQGTNMSQRFTWSSNTDALVKRLFFLVVYVV